MLVEAKAEGPGPRLNITSRCRVRFEVVFDRRKETTAAAGSGLDSDCPGKCGLPEELGSKNFLVWARAPHPKPSYGLFEA